MLLEVDSLSTVSCAQRLVSASGVLPAAEEASGPAGSPLRVVQQWGAGRAERRGSCTPTPPHCHVPPLLSLASGLETVWEQTTNIYTGTVNMES